ncbi:MAG: SprT-like family [Phycisphaerales bacterium]|nr:SprT-like family [Phycisphaerales bacterium]
MKKQVVRIQGLVKIAGHVRREIGRGMSGEHKEVLKASAGRAIAEVDAILRQRGAKPGQLAAPSRRAYQFLASIPWEMIAESTGADKAPPRELRWTGLGRFAERIMARLAREVPEKELEEIARALEQMSRRIERSIEQAGVGPEHLTAQVREWRGWFAWLSEQENLREYVAAVARAREAVAGAARAAGRPDVIVIEFRPSRHIYKMLTRAGTTRIILPTPMIRFDGAAFAMLSQLIFGRGREAKRSVVEQMRTDAYQDLAEELEALAGVVEGTRGAFHDLAQSFDRVNAHYFRGTMQLPRLTWSRSFTGRKFGHYDHVKDWVMVSSTLDQERVPPFVVDYLMFHELLHKRHGIRWVNGCGHAHTREFYADERRFEQYDEADRWLTKLARG